jgi:hypothetical protein
MRGIPSKELPGSHAEIMAFDALLRDRQWIVMSL